VLRGGTGWYQTDSRRALTRENVIRRLQANGFRRLAKVRVAGSNPVVRSKKVRMIAAGVDVRTVSGRLGHRRTSTTTDRYAAFVPAS